MFFPVAMPFLRDTGQTLPDLVLFGAIGLHSLYVGHTTLIYVNCNNFGYENMLRLCYKRGLNQS